MSVEGVRSIRCDPDSKILFFFSKIISKKKNVNTRDNHTCVFLNKQSIFYRKLGRRQDKKKKRENFSKNPCARFFFVSVK